MRLLLQWPLQQLILGFCILLYSSLLIGQNITSDQPSLYAINAGDVLSVNVRNETSLSLPEVLVRPDGFISMPIIGDIQAGGKTIPQVSQSVAQELQKYLRDEPVVTVSLASINGNAIYVLGKVARPGQFIIRSKTDVTQALALAGGITTFADNNSIKVLRRDNNGTQKAIRFNYNQIKSGKNLESNILLQSGDVVLVP